MAALQLLPFRKFAIQMSTEKRGMVAPDASHAADECVEALNPTWCTGRSILGWIVEIDLSFVTYR